MTAATTDKSPLSDQYVAGFIDGEGCLSICETARSGKRKSAEFKAVLSIANTNRDILERIQLHLQAGTIQTMSARPLGQKPAYLLVLGPTTLRDVLPRLLPYLVVKRVAAELMMEFLALPRGAFDEKRDVSDRCRSINRRGLVAA